MQGPHLSVLAPGLSRALQLCHDRQVTPSLTKLIRRGRGVPLGTTSFESIAWALFHMPEIDNRMIPVAAVSFYGLTGRKPDNWCLRIDPAHLQPRRSQLYLIAGKPLSINDQEAEKLIETINLLYAEQGWCVHAPRADQWYLEIFDDPDIITTPITAAVDKDIDRLMPIGRVALFWHARMTEIQMAFHDSPVNIARESEDRFTINSVWPWGSGQIPRLPGSDWEQVWSNEPFTRGLASLNSSPLEYVPLDVGELIDGSASGRGLLVLGDGWSVLERSELSKAVADLTEMEERWWLPFWIALKKRELNSLTIFDVDAGSFTIDHKDVRNWWGVLVHKQTRK